MQGFPVVARFIGGPLNALGMSSDSCVGALNHYLSQVRHLADTLARLSQQDSPSHANDLLRSLQFHVEVDVQSRLSGSGRDRMSEIESAMFLPALRRIRDELAGIAAFPVPAHRMPAIIELERDIAAAVSRIADWDPTER
jgi:hypothetical protein